jgi:hypothetical protein
LFLALAGGTLQPGAYKLGLAICCLIVPLVFALAAWAVELGGGAGILAALLGCVLWWCQPCRAFLQAGDLDLLLAGLAAVLFIALLVRFDRSPGLLCWLGLLITGCLGWWCHPLLFLLLGVLVLVFYLSVGSRHHLGWHVALLIALIGGLAANWFWLTDWLAYLWIWTPDSPPGPEWTSHSWTDIWHASVWGSEGNRALLLVLAAAALVGVGVLNWTRRRPAARLLGMASMGLLGLAVAGMKVPTLAPLGTVKLVGPALCFAVLPSVAALTWLGRRLVPGSLQRTALTGVLLVLGGAAVAGAFHGHLNKCIPRIEGLEIGLNPDRQAVIATLVGHTTPEARILWEEQPMPGHASCWTALLPLLTGRPFLGGLEPGADIEHYYPGLKGSQLAGRRLAEWTDNDLKDFFERYNVGWVACWSPEVVARFQRWEGFAEEVAQLPPPFADRPQASAGKLFALNRRHSFVLKGKAQLLRADCGRVALADVEPEDGQVVLSLHYQAGLQVSPGRVTIERQLDPHDPISFIRLRLPGPVTRISLTWHPEN